MFPYLVIGALLLGLLVVLVVILVIATWRIRLPRVNSVSLAEYPPDALDRQKHLGRQMEQAGFLYVGMQRERRGTRGVWQALFRTPDGAVWGVVEAPAHDSPRVVLHSFFASGRTLTTSDGAFADYNVTERWQLTEHSCEGLLELARMHRGQYRGAGGHPLAIESADDFRDRYQETARREFARLAEVGFLQETSVDGEYRVRPWVAPALALRMLIRSRRQEWMERGPREDWSSAAGGDSEEGEGESAAAPTAGDYLGYYRRDRQRQGIFALLGWTPQGAILFLLLLVVVGVSLSTGRLDGVSLLIIVGVLVAHELGHVITMRLFRFQDFSVFFLPLIGRLTRRRNVRVPSWQEFVVLMMGSLPGLVFGWGLLVLAFIYPETPFFWQKVGFWAALINNVNLLAVLPYDGGRIVNLLIFDRVPTLRVAYLILSAVSVLGLLVLASISFGSLAAGFLWPFVIIALIAFVAVPDSCRQAKVAPWAKRNLSPADDETEALMKAFLIVEQTGSEKSLRRRGWTDVVDRVVKTGCSPKLGGVGTGLALLLLFCCLITPLWVLVGVAARERENVKREHVELQQRIGEHSPSVTWGGAVVTRKTRTQLENLRDHYLVSLKTLYADDLPFTEDAFEYDARGIFDPSEAIEMMRNLRWDEVSTWVAEEDTVARQEVVRTLVESLIGEARDKARGGNPAAAMIDFSRAYWAIATCEPKTSLSAWIDWLYLEHSLLLELEDLMRNHGVLRQYGQWFAETLRRRPSFEGRKLALLLLYDLQGAPTHGMERTRKPGQPKFSWDGAFAEAGFALRRSEADRDFRRAGGSVERSLTLAYVMDATRILQGLPTRGEFQSGVVVADHWADSERLDLAVLDRLSSSAQREIWEARIARIQRLRHFRLLAVAALETEMFGLRPGGLSPGHGAGGALPAQTDLVKTPDNRFALICSAPDGTRFVWKLSPQFAKRRLAR